jgi:hypothetical protein
MPGAGAIGNIIGAFVTCAGHAVALIDMWPAHAVSAVHLGEVAGLRTELRCAPPSVKSYATAWAATGIARLTSPL